MSKPANNLTKESDGTITFPLVIPKEKVSKAYNKVLSITTLKAEIKGFRKGKAPASLVEKQIGKQKLYSETLQHLLPELYAQAVKKYKLKPISSPKIETKSLQENEDWQLQVSVAQKPKINLGNYKKYASHAISSSKIWVPGKDSPDATKDKSTKDSQPTKSSTDEKISKIFDALIENIKFIIPKFLIEEEINRQLSQLIQQIQRLGLTVDQYLASLGKSSDQLRNEYQQQSQRNLRLEFILNEIALDMKIQVQEKEIDDVINAVGDEKLRQKFQNNSERLAIKNSLRKRKVIDRLLTS